MNKFLVQTIDLGDDYEITINGIVTKAKVVAELYPDENTSYEELVDEKTSEGKRDLKRLYSGELSVSIVVIKATAHTCEGFDYLGGIVADGLPEITNIIDDNSMINEALYQLTDRIQEQIRDLSKFMKKGA